MMKFFQITRSLRRLSCLLLIGACVACTDTEDFVQPTLNVSARSLVFSNEAGEQQIGVETNRQHWLATSPVENDWLRLRTENNVLNVSVKPNLSGVERNSYIMVDAGLSVEKIAVRQSASDVVIGFENNLVNLPQIGGETTVDVPTGGKEYRVEQAETAEWIQIIAKKKSLKFITQTNRDVQPRSIALKLLVGDSLIDVKVRQAGVSLFVLPCNPGAPFSLHKMMKFEQERGSLMTEYAQPNPIYELYEESYTFRTTSPLFKDVVYVHDTQTFLPTRIYTRSLVAEGVKAVRSQEFRAFLAEQGYVQDAKDSTIYVNEKESFQMRIDVLEENNSVVLFFDQIFSQEDAYQTFANLDLGPLSLLNKSDKKAKDVLAYETSIGSTLGDRQMSKTNELEAITFHTEKSPLINRTYFFYTRGGETSPPAGMAGSVEQYSLYYDNPNLGVWQRGKNWYVTREFEALLKENGFEFFEDSGNFHVYGRRSDQLVLAIAGGQFSDVNNNQPVLQISVLYKPALFKTDKASAAKKVGKLLLKRHVK